jgi:hypothetical protein
VRRSSRKATPESVLADYDNAQRELLRLLDDVRVDEFALSSTNFGQTRTMEENFRISIEHFEEHAPQLHAAL